MTEHDEKYSQHDQKHDQKQNQTGTGVSLLFVSLHRVRTRFAATLYPDPPTRRSWTNALAASARDVPLLVAEVERLRTLYSDLVAACRAGLLARRDGDNDSEAWQYVEDELPPAPPGHPLHQPTQATQPTTRTRDGGGRHE